MEKSLQLSKKPKARGGKRGGSHYLIITDITGFYNLTPKMTTAETRDALESIDREYAPIGCIGIGGFGSVFLAKKKSGRRVALKFMLMNTNDEDEFDTFTREIGAVVKLNNDSDKESNKTGNRDLSIVFFEDWKIGHHFVCIVMNYADGGTLLQEIERKASRSLIEPYSERRIASYALQICEALAYAHERGVAHHDVKSANILIDASAGGKLLLADFGTSVAPGEGKIIKMFESHLISFLNHI